MPTSPLAYMALPAAVALAGGVLAAFWRPSATARSLVQHFAAGVVLAALAVELLPDIAREHAPPGVTLGAFAAGSVFMYLVKLGNEWLETRDEAAHGGAAPRVAMGLIVATLLDTAMDGFIIGAGFAGPGESGPVLAMGLSVELLFLGLSLASPALGGWRIVALCGLLGAVVLGCAWLGHRLLAGAPHAVIGAALAFSAAALLYLVTEELLMEAHAVPEKRISTLVLFAGFLAFWAVALLGGA